MNKYSKLNERAQDEQKLRLANLIFGEVGSQDDDTKNMVGSTVLNRLTDKKHRYGRNIDDVMNKKNAYYAVKDKNGKMSDEYKKAAKLNFTNENEEQNFDDSMTVAENLFAGEEEPSEGTHYFKKNEAVSLKKKMIKVDDVGKYGVFNDK